MRNVLQITGEMPVVHDCRSGFEACHAELFRIARRELRRMMRSGTIDTVALVNESWLKVRDRAAAFESRAHFIASMTQTMRHVLVDYARERGAQRRGGDWLRVTTGAAVRQADDSHDMDELIAMDQALQQLGRMSKRLERVVELKAFAGMTVAEIAEALGVSRPTVTRDLRTAGAYLGSCLDRPARAA